MDLSADTISDEFSSFNEKMKRAKATQSPQTSKPEAWTPARLVAADLDRGRSELSRLIDSKESIIAEICHYLVDEGGSG